MNRQLGEYVVIALSACCNLKLYTIIEDYIKSTDQRLFYKIGTSSNERRALKLTTFIKLNL